MELRLRVVEMKLRLVKLGLQRRRPKILDSNEEIVEEEDDDGGGGDGDGLTWEMMDLKGKVLVIPAIAPFFQL